MQRKNLDDHEIWYVIEQLVQGIKYLHRNNVIHRDIKPENILLLENLDIKLCDFGFCAPYADGVSRKTVCGTQEYMAPEIINAEYQTFKVDIWCLGILVYEMTHRRSPFSGMN